LKWIASSVVDAWSEKPFIAPLNYSLPVVKKLMLRIARVRALCRFGDAAH